MGLVTQIFDEETLSQFHGDIAVGHNRYSTTGSSELCNAQPIRLQSADGEMALAHNGNVVNAAALRVSLERQGVQFETSMDSEAIAKIIEVNRDKPLEEGLLEVMRQVQGAFSLTMMTHDTLIAMRDPNGVRPVCFGEIRKQEDRQNR
jgi:amidophosphoribosyltransferase